MRVITGTARGIQLKTPTGFLTRPTAERVKEALFSAIQFDIPGARVLDLFAGTGQLGIEALSRGAARAVFVDMRLDACRLVRENLADRIVRPCRCGARGLSPLFGAQQRYVSYHFFGPALCRSFLRKCAGKDIRN